MGEILAADYYVNNARLMEAVAKLWIKPDDRVLDTTYGKGSFWKRYKPETLVKNDLLVGGDDVHHLDFRDMYPWVDGTFDVVVFDPAYVTPGGRETSTIGQMNVAYGMDSAEANLEAQWEVIRAGLYECQRVLKPKGILMVKCMNYISSSRYWNYHSRMIHMMTLRAMTQVDQFMLVKKSGGPQPKNRTRKCKVCRGAGEVVVKAAAATRIECLACLGSGRIATVQVHARNNVSFLIVARNPR